jgi:hypothetical protein
MRNLILAGALAVFGGCATTPSGSSSESRLPTMGAVVQAARAQPWGAELKQIPATVIEVGDLASVPYMSFGAPDIEINVYGDPAKPAGIEIGTKSESPELRAAVRAFIGGLLSESDRQPLATLPDGKEVETNGLALEITPPTAADGFGAWWVTAFHPAVMQASKANVGEIDELAQVSSAPEGLPLAVADVPLDPAYSKYPRYRGNGTKTWSTSYYKQDGVYRRRK